MEGSEGVSNTMISLRGLTKRFGKFTAVDSLDLDIEKADFLTLLGPSGCGKTTTLRMIAGLEDPDEGEIHIGDTCAFSTSGGILMPPASRKIGMIFQSYALWPHMTVFQNISFGLERRGLTNTEVATRVEESMDAVKLVGLADRYPSELSGGQQQRVAVARVLAIRPQIFLMDEPLSNLDAKLRLDMRVELKRLHTLTGATSIYVTHDQHEALTMSTLIAVMKDGGIQQLASPQEIYERPENIFVADFVGSPPINLVKGRLESSIFATDDFQIALPEVELGDQSVTLGIRPEHLNIEATHRPGTISAKVYSVLPAGSETVIQVLSGETMLTITCSGYISLEVEQPVFVNFSLDHVLLFSTNTQQRIYPVNA